MIITYSTKTNAYECYFNSKTWGRRSLLAVSPDRAQAMAKGFIRIAFKTV